MLLLPFPATIPGERKSYPLYIDLSSGKVYVTDPLLDQKVPWLGIIDVAFDVNDSDLNALVHLWRELHGRSNPIPKHRLSGRLLWYDIIKTLEKQVDQLQDVPAREFNTREKLKHVSDAKELPTPRDLAIAVINFFQARELRSRLETARSDVASLREELKTNIDNVALEKQVQHLEEQIQRVSAVVVPIPNVDKLREQIQTLHVQNRDLDQQVRREQLRFNLQRQIAFSKIPATDSLRVQELQKQQRALQSELDALLQKINAEEAPVVSDYERVQAKAAESAQKRIQTIHQYQIAVAKQEEAKAAVEHEKQQLAAMNALREQKLLEPNEVAAIDAEIQNLDRVMKTPSTLSTVHSAIQAAKSSQRAVLASVKARTPQRSGAKPIRWGKNTYSQSPQHWNDKHGRMESPVVSGFVNPPSGRKRYKRLSMDTFPEPEQIPINPFMVSDATPGVSRRPSPAPTTGPIRPRVWSEGKSPEEKKAVPEGPYVDPAGTKPKNGLEPTEYVLDDSGPVHFQYSAESKRDPDTGKFSEVKPPQLVRQRRIGGFNMGQSVMRKK